MVDNRLKLVRVGLLLAMLTLFFGIGMGVAFGVNEDVFKDFVAEGIAAHPQVHDDKSTSKIWRYVQRAHFHAAGIGAFSLGLIVLVAMSGLTPRLKRLSAALIGLSGVYSLSWLSMFLLAPSMGRDAAHHALLTETFTYIGVGAALAGIALLCLNLFFNLGTGQERRLDVRGVEAQSQTH